jgi:predicted ATPase/DNA-binding SARP family transcriptional activator
MGTDVGVGVLGPVELRLGDEVVAVDGLKRRQVLAVLVAARGAAVSESRLCEALWDSRPPETATTSLHSHVSRLRRAVRPLSITSTTAGYVIDLAGVEVDAERFERLVARARTSTGSTAVHQLHEALGLWRGTAFGDLAELAGVRGEALRLEELRLVATEEWIEARLAIGEDAGVIGELDSLLTDHPLRERFWRQAMLALYRCGRQREALARADRLRRMLRDEFGLDPSPAVQDLEARILADDPGLRTVPARQPARVPMSKLPDVTSLIGRHDDVERVLGAIGPRALVTVSGPGGVGKSRVAWRAAAAAGREFLDGLASVELAPVREPSAVVEVVARALDVQQRQHRSLEESVVDFLVDKRLLLVLDNCEHVIDEVASLVDRVRQRCEGVCVLTTSRAPLGLPDEHVHVLTPLAIPAHDADAASIVAAPAGELFAERAATARPGFSVDQHNARAVAEICRRLDGLPLALELAAARVRTMGPDALAARLDQRFALLAGGRRGIDERHHTLGGVVEWSYDLLDPVEQEVFVQLSVFAGSFGLPAAEAVCRVGDGESSVASIVNLVDKSMVRLEDPSEPRYVVLETMREFGQARLRSPGQLTDIEERHRRWHLQLAVDAGAGVDTDDERSWIERLDRELDNIRAAHASAVRAGDVDVAAGLVVALREYSFRRIRYEVTGLAETTMSIDGFDRSPHAPIVAGVAAYGRWVRGDLESAIELATTALEMQERVGTSSVGLLERVLGNATFYLGRIDDAVAWTDRMVGAVRADGSTAQLAHAMYMSSVARTSVGRHDLGLALAEESNEAATATGSPTALAQAEYARGLALRSTDITASDIHLRRSAELGERAGNRWIRAFALTEVHWLSARQGDLIGGLAGYADVIDTWHRGGDWANLWLSLRHVFGILTQLEHHEIAAVLHGALVAAGAAYALPFEPGDAERLEQQAQLLRRVLGPAPFATAVRRGTAMGDSETVSFVQSAITGVD